MTTRSQTEIAARYDVVRANDFFGFAGEVLLPRMDFEHAKPFLNDDMTAEKFGKIQSGLVSVREEAEKYLEFAWGKAEDHRGLSAGRSVAKLTEYCWLLGLDIDAIEAASYQNYGAPKLAVVARLLGKPLPVKRTLVRMMNGESCDERCENGCGEG